MQCYCLYHRYEYILIDLSSVNSTTTPACPKAFPISPMLSRCNQPVAMYKRHCVVAELLRQRTDITHILFNDADMGVINPNHLLEEYVHLREREPATGQMDLVFAERQFTNEIMAGSYFARLGEHFWCGWGGFSIF